MATDPIAGMFTFHDTSSFFFPENPTLDPSDELPSINHQNHSNHTNQQPGQNHEPDDIFDPNDPLSDPVIWAAFCADTDDLPGNSQAGHSVFPGDSTGGHGGPINDNNFNNLYSTVIGDSPMPLTVFSVPPQYNCICCQILREITHTNGTNMKRLEIHGRIGVITHAVLGIYGFDSSFHGEDIQMFDFHNESTQMVKKFLVQYFEECKREGYNMMQDPLSKFYEALCVGLNDFHNPDDFIRSSPENTGDISHSQQELGEGGNQVGFMRIPLSMQRERTRNLRLKDFVDCFDLPIEDAARKMNICPTVIKKICRKNGVLRWPYRKIKSIKKKISNEAKIVDLSDDQERARALEDIRKHRRELEQIYESFNK
ncbi:hypothetical protein OROGR_031820 [Orobanche gracilis]